MGLETWLEVNYIGLKSLRAIRRDAPGREPSRALRSGSSECARTLHYAQLDSSVCLALWLCMFVPNNTH